MLPSVHSFICQHIPVIHPKYLTGICIQEILISKFLCNKGIKIHPELQLYKEVKVHGVRP